MASDERTGVETPTLTPDALAVQASLEKFLRLERERDALKAALDAEHKARMEDIRTREDMITALQARIDVINAELRGKESDIVAANKSRDEAVADRAVFEVLFITIRTMMEKFEFPREALADLRRAIPPTNFTAAEVIARGPSGEGENAGDKQGKAAT